MSHVSKSLVLNATENVNEFPRKGRVVTAFLSKERLVWKLNLRTFQTKLVNLTNVMKK
jgi:hypothetical protein